MCKRVRVEKWRTEIDLEGYLRHKKERACLTWQD